MGTEDPAAASNPGSPAEGADMVSDAAVTRYLRAAPVLACPDDVLTRLRATIAGEVELRRASDVDPDHDTPELKTRPPLWSDDRVHDTLHRHPRQNGDPGSSPG